MAQFKAMAENVEVNGETVLSIAEGMSFSKSEALRILAENGIKDPKPGMWYPQQSWLNAFEVIAKKIGANTLFLIGMKIPENAKFPPQIDSIEKALPAIDVAYHMNHRINGELLFNPANGQMKEGIGHYGFKKTGEKEAVMECNNPYPCDFDRGIIEAMAKRFKPQGTILVSITHSDNMPCRKNGADSCTYKIKW